MTETKFTPGPWKNKTVLVRGLTFIASANYETDIGDANAHLIAAAPELYEALEALFNSYKDLADSGDAGFWKLEDQKEGKKALAALAKARGEV